MSVKSPSKASHFWFFTLIITCLLFLESAIPYINAEKKAPQNTEFLGQIANVPDQNMYFSFISQARDGHVIFKNKLTAIPHDPAFLNLQFCLVGWIQRLTGISENATYQVWRFLGVLLLTSGFVFLANVVLSSRKRVMAATVVALFSGGFGFLIATLRQLHLVGPDTAQAGIIDMRFGLMPFQQMTSNPNFSFPHGLILFGYAFFLLGEKYRRTSSYVVCGLIFDIIGLVRPYDILPPLLLFPLFVALTEGFKGFDIKLWVKRLIPLFMIAPVLLYNVWLFKVNDIFKWWSLQGLNADMMPSVLWHYLAFGICGLLALWRISQGKSHPLNRIERFLVVWFTVTFAIIHLGKYFPVIGWSPQIGVYLGVPLTLLGFSVRYPDRKRSKVLYFGIPVVTALLVLASNFSIVAYFLKVDEFTCYADKDETAAWQWMRKNIKEGSLVVASHYTSPRIAKYTGARVVLGHYSVTPRYKENRELLDNFFTTWQFDSSRLPVLQKLNADYLYIGPKERYFGAVYADSTHYLKRVYNNPSVAVYKFQP